MLKRAVLVIGFVILAFAVASVYVGGVASLTTRVVRFFRRGPRMAAPGTIAADGWEFFAETLHFRYYVRPGDHIERWALGLAEDHLDAASGTLQVASRTPFDYYKHPSQQDLYEATGSQSTGVTRASDDGQHQEMHSVHGYDPHEVMHALAHETMGEPPAFFDEGLATAFGWDWTPGEQDVHERATALLDEGRLVPLRRLLTNWDFRSYKTYPAYTTAGSFVKYLLQTYGAQKLCQLFELDKYSQQAEIEQCFLEVYDQGIYRVEESWREVLQSGILLAAMSRPDSQRSNTPLVVTGVALFGATFLGAVLFIVAGEKFLDAAIRNVRDLKRTIGERLDSKAEG